MSSWRFRLILICACLSCNLLQHWLSVCLQVDRPRTNLLWLFGEWRESNNKHITRVVLRDVWLRWQSLYNYLFLSFLRSSPNYPLTRKLLQRVRLRPMYEWQTCHTHWEPISELTVQHTPDFSKNYLQCHWSLSLCTLGNQLVLLTHCPHYGLLTVSVIHKHQNDKAKYVNIYWTH